MGFYQNRLRLQDLQESRGKLKNSHGFPSESMGMHGNPWGFMEIMVLVEIHGFSSKIIIFTKINCKYAPHGYTSASVQLVGANGHPRSPLWHSKKRP